MEFVPLVAMGLLIVQVINFLKYLRAGDINGWFTTLVAWVSGVCAVLLVAQTDFADGISIGDQALSTLNFASLIFVGMTVASLGGYAVEIKKAIDQSDSAAKPDLVTKT